ncbi:hypothetical protein [Dyadobacter frigoris]|uniref:Uncharacterized protein n=1 Tax=Dyadobacter frigoris TaxID=2576211 RepID=A0A4U6CV54_9BACT|nr:hypothetical protein [Dyadobacter frigoris]TKT88620.1 hypothetical protein FDK13_27125 [Dyadobacter frigoris]GLU54954.1 hypothetical protein Dfri01_44150 [Dyadobacter frigoris]
MKNILFYAIVVVFGIISCTDKNEDEMNIQQLGGYFSGSLDIMIKDKNGFDMLDVGNPNSLKKFKVYYLLNGKKELYSKSLMYAPNGYVIEKFATDSYYHMQLFINSPNPESTNNNNWITYLEFEDGSTDTIKASFDIKPGYIAVERASYNDKLAWNPSQNNGVLQTFELTKQ